MRNKIREWYYPTKSKIYVAGLTANQFEQGHLPSEGNTSIQLLWSFFHLLFFFIFLILTLKNCVL